MISHFSAVWFKLWMLITVVAVTNHLFMELSDGLSHIFWVCSISESFVQWIIPLYKIRKYSSSTTSRDISLVRKIESGHFCREISCIDYTCPLKLSCCLPVFFSFQYCGSLHVSLWHIPQHLCINILIFFYEISMRFSNHTFHKSYVMGNFQENSPGPSSRSIDEGSLINGMRSHLIALMMASCNTSFPCPCSIFASEMMRRPALKNHYFLRDFDDTLDRVRDVNSQGHLIHIFGVLFQNYGQ